MKKPLFEHELTKAQTLYKYGKDEEKDYWRGYMRGIRRRYHGEKFDTEDAHQQWLGFINDDYHREVGRGYRAGYFGPARVTTDHATSSYGIPVFVDLNNNSMDYVDGFIALRDWWGIDDVANAAGVSSRTAEGWCSGRMPGTDALLMLMHSFLGNATNAK